MGKIIRIVIVATIAVLAFSCSSLLETDEAKQARAEAKLEQGRTWKIEEEERERVEWLRERAELVLGREKEELSKYNEELAKYEEELAKYERERAKYIDDFKKIQMSKYARLSRWWVNYFYEKKFGIESDRVYVASGDNNNPYNFERDRYYYISLSEGYVSQWLDSYSVLFYLEGGQLTYLHWNDASLNKKFDKEVHSDCLFIYEGVYEYKTVSGSMNRVPKFKMISMEYKTEEDIENQATEQAMLSYGKAMPEKPETLEKPISEKVEFSQRFLSGFVFVEGDDGVSDFYMDESEVTQLLYGTVMGEDMLNSSRPCYPERSISWYDAVNFCNRLSRICGLDECYVVDDGEVACDFNRNGYRLPTEAEWEWAAKGGVKSKGCKYSGSNRIGDVAWYDGNSGSSCHSVRLKKPNELGIYDMSGNVSEWCWDSYPISSSRVHRGGSWYDDAENCAVSYRHYRDPSFTYGPLGFRLVRSARD